MARSPDRGPLVRAALAEASRSAFGRLSRFGRGRVRLPDRLLFAPQDARIPDPSAAHEMAQGIFAFAGKPAVLAGGASPFGIPPPSQAWAAELLGLGWLRNFRPDSVAALRPVSRGLVEDALFGRRRVLDRGIGATPSVVARRLAALLAHSPALLTGADHGFYRRYLRRIAVDAALLRQHGTRAPRPLDRLAAAIGLCLAGLSCAGYERQLRRATQSLAAELDAQILPDGGHVGRNPADLVELLLDLVPLRLLYASRAVEIPPALERAIDRMVPMVRFFRHGCGDLALFNGMGRTPSPDVAALLTQDKVRAAPVQRASASGYDRLQAGRTLVIMDTGGVPPLAASASAHAGCLSFELSSGIHRIVINCGAPATPGPTREAARRTAAHSTLVLGGLSSAFPLDGAEPAAKGSAAALLVRRFGPVLLPGPRLVGAERGRSGDDIVLSAHHDGYLDAFETTHTRRLRLSADGSELEGEDGLAASASAAGDAVEALIRFHLHPGVAAEPEEASGGLLLRLPDGERWRFGAEGIRPRLAESVVFAVSEGRRPTRQIVVPLTRPAGARHVVIRWIFVRA